MVTKSAHTLNNSPRRLADVEKLAKTAPAVAKSYLKEVATRLTEFGEKKKAAVVKDLLDDPDLSASLKSKASKLGEIFPTQDGGFAAMQEANAAAIGYTTTEEKTPPSVYISGKVKVSETNTNGYPQKVATLTTENGRKLNLVEGDSEMGLWFNGLVDDGNFTLKGKLDVTGNFKVGGFALNRDGKFDEFVFGRVSVYGDKVSVNTPEGDVEITNAELKKKLKQLPELGVILPGGEKVTGSKRKYDKDPAEFFALGRFTNSTIKPPEGQVKGRHVLCDFAMSVFANQPFVLPKGQESRAKENGRFWALGDFKYLREKKLNEYGDTGLGGQFQASYVSKATDNLSVAGYGDSDANAVQAAVMLAEADDDIAAK